MLSDPGGRTMRERMLAGDLYIADDPDLAEHNLRAMDLMEAFNATPARAAARRRERARCAAAGAAA